MTPRKSALGLMLLGLLAAAFFWLTDVGYGYGEAFTPKQNLTDLINQTLPGTFVGWFVSVLIFFTGLVLLARR